MDTKEKRLALVDQLIENLGLTRDEVVNYFTKSSSVQEEKQFQSKIDIKQVKPGMIWYEDDTFSFERIADKKIKAIVELVEDGIIYGDLTASDIEKIEEVYLNWYETEEYIKNFSYSCQKNEKIAWYSFYQFNSVHQTYADVARTFYLLHKRCRKMWYWSSTESNRVHAWGLGFSSGTSRDDYKYDHGYIRPVLAMKVC